MAVELADGRFAMVHPVWHGHIDQYPDRFPHSLVFADLPEFQAHIDGDAEEWAAQE